MRKLVALFLLMGSLSFATAQEVLPAFSAATRGNGKIIISWSNPYPVVSQISIQRSRDSIKGFASIISVPDPTAQQNGFVDSKAPDARYFYRLFIVLDSGKYVFTKSRRAFWDTVRVAAVPANRPPAENAKRVMIAEKVTPKQAEEIKEKFKPLLPVQNRNPESFLL